MNQRTNLPTARAISLRSLARGGVLLLLALLAGACSREDDPNLLDDETLVPLQVKASIGAELAKPVTRDYNPVTRARVYRANTGKPMYYTPPKTPGGVWTGTSEAYVGVQKENFCIMVGSLVGDVTQIGTPILFVNPLNGYLSTRALTKDDLQKEGAWYGSAEASKSNPIADFGSLKQFCTCITLNITNYLGDEAILSDIYVRYPYYGKMLISSGINPFTGKSMTIETDEFHCAPADDLPYTLESTNTLEWISAPIGISMAYDESFDLILTINGQDYSVKITNKDLNFEYVFDKGTRYTFNLVIRGTELTLASPIRMEEYGEYQDVALGGPESYGIQLKPEQMYTNQEVPMCMDRYKQKLSQLRWAESNLIIRESTDITYCGNLSTKPEDYFCDWSVIGSGIDPCSKLDPSLYGIGWRMPVEADLTLLVYCTNRKADYRWDASQGGSQPGGEFMQSSIGLYLPLLGVYNNFDNEITYKRLRGEYYASDGAVLYLTLNEETNLVYPSNMLRSGNKGLIRCVKGPVTTFPL